MRDPRSQVEINATPQRVWEVLTDWPSFPAWNPFIRSATGTLAEGSRVRIQLRLGSLLVPLRPVITRVDPPRELRWQANLPVRGIFDVERRFRIEPTSPDAARLVQSESPTGLLAPVLGRLLFDDIVVGYRALETAIKARAEGKPDHTVIPLPTSKTRSAMAQPRPRAVTGPPAWKTRITSHETFTHDSIDSLGYDWERVANPGIAPRFPRKVYLPRTTEDVVAAVRECKTLGEPLTIRSKGHSSNDLVLTDGALLATDRLNQIVQVDEKNLRVTVQAGAISAQVDDELAKRGLGLPVIGDHNHITVGGFASVGGISPASHRFGLFVDTVERLEYVTWDGELVSCSREKRSSEFFKVLTGLGRHGVIVTLTVRMIRVDKYGTVLKNRQRHYYSVEKFIEGTAASIRNPGAALMERGVWVDIPLPVGPNVTLGQFSAYHETRQTPWAKARDLVAYNALHGLGYVSGTLPAPVDQALKYVGMAGVMFSPMYATMKNVEFFTDKILDSTVGDPTRMFIVLAPLDAYEDLFRASYELMREFRNQHDCFTFISVYVKAITSPYLARGGENDRFCELMFYCGMAEGGMDRATLDNLVLRLDDIVIAHAGLRYMHSLTSTDPGRRDKVDPNMHYARYAELLDPNPAAEEEQEHEDAP